MYFNNSIVTNILYIVISDFELQLYYYIHFQANTLWKSINSLTPTSRYKLNSIMTT